MPHFLTVIMPAYNEVERIGETLTQYSRFLEDSPRWSQNHAILVVDDGSNDGTAAFVRERFSSYADCCSLPENQGKGAAIAFGIQHLCDNNMTPDFVLIADADGSADICCLDDCFEKLRSMSDPALVVGTRDGASSWTRSVLRWGFRTAVQILSFCPVRDSQCGFKLLTWSAAKPLYRHLYLRRWSHDVEVLYRAYQLGFGVDETPISWQDKEGSKLLPRGTTLWQSIQVSSTMLLDIVNMRIQYATGQWQLPKLE